MIDQGTQLRLGITASNRSVETEVIVAAYRETGSVWKAGKRLGLAGQTVHERLHAIGYPLRGRNWSQEEVDELCALAEAGVPMSEAACRLGRPFGGTAGKASQMGLRFRGPKSAIKLPRGAGFDKQSTTAHMRALEAYEHGITRYARAHGLNVDMLVLALERHCIDRFRSYVESRSDLPRRACAYCEREFVPVSGKQRYCSRKCSADGRADRGYFAGNRRRTVGMDAGICQLCGREGKRGLSAHHVLGRDNDPDAETLIALCPGCHKAVTLLASRKFVNDPSVWEALISLAWLRHNGHQLPTDANVVHVSVDLDVYEDESEVGVEREAGAPGSVCAPTDGLVRSTDRPAVASFPLSTTPGEAA